MVTPITGVQLHRMVAMEDEINWSHWKSKKTQVHETLGETDGLAYEQD